MTKRECAVIMEYTGTCMLTGDDLKYFYEYIAELMGRPVYSHEIPALADVLKEKAKPDFIRICREAAEADETINLSEVAGCDEFICKECGIHLTNWERVDGNMWAEEYEFKFCPNCGKVVRGMPEIRLIDANAFLEKVLPECKYPDALKKAVENQPTIEPEVRHGRWIPIEYDSYANGDPVWDKFECSECGHEHNGEEDTLTAFCPDCGARMGATDTNVGGKGGADNG